MGSNSGNGGVEMELFDKALYYAVREDYNSSITPGYIDKKNDALIREAINYIESGNKFPNSSYVNNVSVQALARAANRREIRGNLPDG